MWPLVYPASWGPWASFITVFWESKGWDSESAIFNCWCLVLTMALKPYELKSEIATPLIPTSVRRVMAKQVVCRATTERLPSEFARWPLGRRSVFTRQTTCSAIIRQSLMGISGVDGLFVRAVHMLCILILQKLHCKWTHFADWQKKTCKSSSSPTKN